MISVPAPLEDRQSEMDVSAQISHCRLRIDLSRDWQFARSDQVIDSAAGATVFRDASWDTVTLPHTPRLESAAVQFPFQGICWYRKSLRAQPAWVGKRVMLEFGAGMQIADVWVEGEHRLRHLGGYLPFSVDLSDTLGCGLDAQVAVRLDNRDTDLCPPGKPLAELDFSYFGGLYREAQLHVTGEIHISDPLRANQPAGGGIFVRCDNASAGSATVQIRTHALNESATPARRCKVVSEIYSPGGELLRRAESAPLMIAAGEGHHFEQAVSLTDPCLWHPDHPGLHTLVSRLYADERQTDELRTRFGVRHIGMGQRFFLNGEPCPIIGTNRHQEHPYVGNAVPANAHRRDARRIKDAGFNFVRLSHYPQDPAFLDACDELGLLVQAAVPGWQQFWMNRSFVSRSFQDIRDLVRRDRNHPCIVFWEPNLNETGVGEDGEGHSDWCRAAHEITHQEYPGSQCLTFGDDYPGKPGWDWDVRGLCREYGDFGFGGNESTSRHTRGEGEAAMLQQAWNYLWTFNHLSAQLSDPHRVYCGCATWVMFDYNRGYSHKPCTCGMMDMFRLPKYVYYFYQSQRDPRGVRDDVESGPLVFIASDWTKRAGLTKVIVFSNCDEVELLLNGRVLGRKPPDSGPDTEYSDAAARRLATVGNDYDRSGGRPFDGGNARHIPHPPTTFFDIPYAEGKLTAVGYLEGRPVACAEVSAPGKPDRLQVSVDLAGVPLAPEGNDLVFVHARLVDPDRTLVPDVPLDILFAVDGAAELIGSNPVRTEGGIASILVKTGTAAGTARVIARSPDSGSRLTSHSAELI